LSVEAFTHCHCGRTRNLHSPRSPHQQDNTSAPETDKAASPGFGFRKIEARGSWIARCRRIPLTKDHNNVSWLGLNLLPRLLDFPPLFRQEQNNATWNPFFGWSNSPPNGKLHSALIRNSCIRNCNEF